MLSAFSAEPAALLVWRLACAVPSCSSNSDTLQGGGRSLCAVTCVLQHAAPGVAPEGDVMQCAVPIAGALILTCTMLGWKHQCVTM